MQNRYVGDIGDYSKLFLIKHLFNKKSGIIWYLYPNEAIYDKRIDYEKYNLKDKEIVEIMKKFSKIDEEKKNIKEFENLLEKNDFDLSCFDEGI
jgi:hypothetical protein